MKIFLALLLVFPLLAQTRHVLQAIPENVVIDYYDATMPPSASDPFWRYSRNAHVGCRYAWRVEERGASRE